MRLHLLIVIRLVTASILAVRIVIKDLYANRMYRLPCNV